MGMILGGVSGSEGCIVRVNVSREIWRNEGRDSRNLIDGGLGLGEIRGVQ